MIRIISGAVGIREGKRTVLKSSESGPLTLDKELEQRLVAQGFAEYTDGADEPIAGDEDTAAQQNSAPVNLEKMNRNALIEEATKRGIAFEEDATRKDLIALISEFENSDGEPDASLEDDGAPVINPTEVE